MILYFIIREFLSSLFKRTPFSTTHLYKGFNFYNQLPCKGKKPLFVVLFDLERLCQYWKCFPDSYFRFHMFSKTYTDYELMKTFIPQRAYARKASSKNPQYNILIDDKILFHDIMKYYKLPTTHHYFVWKNKTFFVNSSIVSDDEVDSIIKTIRDERIYVKCFRGGAASGISVFLKKETGYYDNSNNKLSADLIKRKFSDSNYIFEKQIVQEPVLRQLNPDTVNTIRVLTKEDKIVAASVRVGRKGAFIDNASKGGIVLSLDIETGVLSDYGMRIYDIKKYYKHPDTGYIFSNTYVSQWEEVRKVVLRTLKLLPYYKSVGFDIATTADGPIIIEINTGAGVGASQMGKEVGIADEFI